MSHHQTPNRLIDETSPYLLQHAYNPVDWHPWGPKALQLAKDQGKPIFLSVGYSACHWCHVMERESFENANIAELMNQWFINIKVDREERPDIDQIYMTAVQAMQNGHGGWPMSVFLTPEGEPFFGGTYYPPKDHRGMPGFPRVLEGVHRAWTDRRDQVREAASQLVELLQSTNAGPPETLEENLTEMGPELIQQVVIQLARSFDAKHGGFGDQPKFPHPMGLKLLLRQYARTQDTHALHMAVHTLDKMARGGIYDHLGGGFARYSTDDAWLVPHFEKMLYDNALLLSAYLEAYQVTSNPDFARIARETIEYLLERMTSPDGGFYSTEDADSEGEEGKFYVWSRSEVVKTLGQAQAETFCYVYDVTDVGNWEGSNILNQPKNLDQCAKLLGIDRPQLETQLAESRAKLKALRETRVRPGRDEKILASWNGLLIGPLAEAGWILGESRYTEAASKAAGFLLDKLIDANGLLRHSWKDGQAKFNGYLDDYANLIDSLTRLFECTGEQRWIQQAIELSDVMIREFHDSQSGGFHYTGASHEPLIARPKETHDNATPAASSSAALALARLAILTDRSDFQTIANQCLSSLAPAMIQIPSASGQALIALDFTLDPPREYTIVAGDQLNDFQAAMRLLHQSFQPHKVIAPNTHSSPEVCNLVPLLKDRPARQSNLTVYVCQNSVCQAPVIGISEFRKIVS